VNEAEGAGDSGEVAGGTGPVTAERWLVGQECAATLALYSSPASGVTPLLSFISLPFAASGANILHTQAGYNPVEGAALNVYC